MYSLSLNSRANMVKYENKQGKNQRVDRVRI